MSFVPYPLSISMRDGNRPFIDGYPHALWRERCTNVWVGILFEVSSRRASNWHYYDLGTIYSNRYDDSDAFHRTRWAAETQVEGKRSRGASWKITEWPCLVAANNRGSVSVVQMNTNRPFESWHLEFGRGRRLGAIASSWANEADRRRRDKDAGSKYCSFTHMFVNTPDMECRCGRYVHPMYAGSVCESCFVAVASSQAGGEGFVAPPIRTLTAPCRYYTSSSDGGGFRLAWSQLTTRSVDLEPAFFHVSRLITHLSVA